MNPVSLRDVGELERGIKSFAHSSSGGLIIAASGLAYIRLNLIIKLATQYRLPAVYFDRAFVGAGGLMSYGQTCPINLRVPLNTSTAFLRVRSRATCPCKRRRSISSLSTLRLPRR